jgi:hypothetical protein
MRFNFGSNRIKIKGTLYEDHIRFFEGIWKDHKIAIGAKNFLEKSWTYFITNEFFPQAIRCFEIIKQKGRYMYMTYLVC